MPEFVWHQLVPRDDDQPGVQEALEKSEETKVVLSVSESGTKGKRKIDILESPYIKTNAVKEEDDVGRKGWYW